MNELFTRILLAQKKRLLGSQPVFEPYKPASPVSVHAIERRLGCKLPVSMQTWLLHVGYGDFNKELSLREEWFNPIDRGQLRGHIIFSQDIIGNFYAFSPTDGVIHYICRSAPEYAVMAKDFGEFLEEFESRSFELGEWVDGLQVSAYDWSV